MRIRTLVLAILLGLTFASPAAAQGGPPAAPEGTGRIAGLVTRGDTGRPIGGATIRLVQWVGGVGYQKAARTDARGRFEFTKLPAGSYQVTAQAEGVVSLEYGQRRPSEPGVRIELIDGQNFEDADVELPKTSAIEGRLLDEFGDPVPGVMVQVAQVQFAAGKRRLMPMGGPAANARPTDDLGQFRVSNLAPGDYYLLALCGPFAAATDSPGFAVTYYPGTAAPPEAKPVRVAAGQDVNGVTFAMTPAPMAAISGVTLDADGQPLPRAEVMLIATSGGDVRTLAMGRMPSGPDGSFTFRNVAYGTYVIQAYGRPVGGGNLGKAPFGALPLVVAGDRDDLRVQILTGAVVRGRILFEGDAPRPAPNRVMVTAAPVEFVSGPLGGGPPNTVTHEDWTFDVQNMQGLGVIRPNIGAPGWILKSVMAGGRDVTDAAVDFRKGDINDVEITLTSRASAVSGSVMDGDIPARDYAVVLFADDAASWTFPSRFLAVARPAPQGGFRIAGLPPAAYLAVALPSVSNFEFQDPEFLQALRPFATRVVLNEGDTKTIALGIIKR